MSITRMRFPAQALEELKRDDPDTAVTIHFIRSLVKRGDVPSIKIGRRLLNYDALVRYLQEAGQAEQGKNFQQLGVIRKVSER